ncbi:hypothetical protein [Nonomuraea typhae]|uniref:hypothetical protein n=1 Tax=Nonomuraea typhae TaxID=2603600 RepID=UPI0012F99B10|nr:hypothetical protein [Nonomuraea typhae]
MRVRFLGKATQGGGSPTLYDTDETMNDEEIYLLQGWKITDPEILAQFDFPDHEIIMAVPKRLMKHLPKDNPYGTAEG